MIRLLTEQDHANVMEFLSEEPALNLFIIGDIENFGYETSFQQLWGEWIGDELNAVLLRYNENFLPYSRGKFNVHGFAEIMKKHEQFQILSGKEEIVNQFEGLLPVGKKRSMYFAELVDNKSLENDMDRSEIQVADENDVDKILSLRTSIEEFSDSVSSREGLIQAIRSGSGRTYFMTEDDKAIASVSTTAENSLSAMVIGVCTAASHRNRGLASKCLSMLCHDLLEEEKSLCLFYDNPAAGSIYKRLGFHEIGRWTMWHKAV
ncbi:GNAT family N-acetyltransferase [Pseudalkalibacillus sp. SCS-8]|uniref:GNAT family N-acetyltransferase n=1 Tax=Pseudalkalibacillus nanhaiensis TaxID=3115291 RepID=UPI0032DA242B